MESESESESSSEEELKEEAEDQYELISLSEKEKNEISAKLLRAELMGNDVSIMIFVQF